MQEKITGQDGVTSDEDTIRSLKEFPRPSNRSELKRFVYLAEQLANGL